MARDLWVGPNESYKTLASAVAASRAGDVINLRPGEYVNDFAVISHDLTIVGTGGGAHLRATGNIPNGKAILVTKADVTIENVEFSGAQVHDRNGAGIRYVEGDLVLKNTHFHHNQNGILGGKAVDGSIRIEDSEFDHNGIGDGRTHNAYVGHVRELVVENSSFHDAVVGHNLKSRAEITTITDSRFEDGPRGSASYGIDLPNGGVVTLEGNTIQKGPHAENDDLVAYGAEGRLHDDNAVILRDNTFISDMGHRPTTAFRNYTDADAGVEGNTFVRVAHDYTGTTHAIADDDGGTGHGDGGAPQQPDTSTPEAPAPDAPSPDTPDQGDGGMDPTPAAAVNSHLLGGAGPYFARMVEVVNTSEVAIPDAHIVVEQDATLTMAWNARQVGGGLEFSGIGGADGLAPGESWSFAYMGFGDADPEAIRLTAGGSVVDQSDWVL